MHSFDTKTATFFFDGGLINGDLIIAEKDKDGIHTGVDVRIDANDILQLVAYKYAKDELISRIEDMDWRELLLRGMK